MENFILRIKFVSRFAEIGSKVKHDWNILIFSIYKEDLTNLREFELKYYMEIMFSLFIYKLL